jgi:hypothetical protein
VFTLLLSRIGENVENLRREETLIRRQIKRYAGIGIRRHELKPSVARLLLQIRGNQSQGSARREVRKPSHVLEENVLTFTAERETRAGGSALPTQAAAEEEESGALEGSMRNAQVDGS